MKREVEKLSPVLEVSAYLDHFPRITSYLRKISGKMGQFVRLRSQLPILEQAPSITFQ